MPNPTPEECPGEWREVFLLTAPAPYDEVEVLVCSGCGERWSFYQNRSFTYPPNFTYSEVQFFTVLEMEMTA